MLLHGDAGALPFGENACDAIVCDLPFEVVSRFGYSLDTSRGSTLAKCACEWARVLKPAGKVVLLTSEEQAQNVHEALEHAALAVTCERPCPLGFTKAVIIVAGHKDDNAAPATEATRGGLPWESAHGRRSEWHVMRKGGEGADDSMGVVPRREICQSRVGFSDTVKHLPLTMTLPYHHLPYSH